MKSPFQALARLSYLPQSPEFGCRYKAQVLPLKRPLVLSEGHFERDLHRRTAHTPSTFSRECTSNANESRLDLLDIR